MTTLAPEQRESAIDQAQRRAMVSRESLDACMAEFNRTGKRVYLVMADVHQSRAEASRLRAQELIRSRE
jgi:hypothetical protein